MGVPTGLRVDQAGRPHGNGPIFWDASGRRAGRAKVSSVVGSVVVVLVVLALFVPTVLDAPGAHMDGPSLTDVGASPTVVGAGPYVRIARVDASESAPSLIDPFSESFVGELTEEESDRVGDAAYVIQRYGSADRSRLFLTFEGGPSEQFTPQILDALERSGAQATFFITGANAARNPDLVRQIADAGHLVAPASMSHVHMSAAPPLRSRQELVWSERVIRELTGSDPEILRLPYMKSTEDEAEYLPGMVLGILAGQERGYAVLGFDHDSGDLAQGRDLEMPAWDGSDQVVQVHDGGAPGREKAVDYVSDILAEATGNGYSAVAPVRPASRDQAGLQSWLDRVALLEARIVYSWSGTLMLGLFAVALFGVLVVSGTATVLAFIRARRRRQLLASHGLDAPSPEEDSPAPPLAVSVLLAAYNEERVIARTLESLGQSDFPVLEILVVDDGSTDSTAERVLEVAQRDPRVRLVRQSNTGKSGALNHGFRSTIADVVVTVDADTIVHPGMIGNLVRHFTLPGNEDLAAVAGFVRVGNASENVITRWQSLEYVTQIGVDRASQDILGAISIVPGACAAWRRIPVLQAGGYSEDTLAEDCDLCLTLHRDGWRVTQDDEAVALTEAPASMDDLLKQRSRWTFGTLQAVYKNRDMLFRRRYGWLGMFVLPWYALSILLPLVTLPAVVVLGWMAYRAQGWGVLVVFFALFVAVNIVIAGVGIHLTRSDWRLLAIVPIYRVLSEPLRAYLLYTSAWKALTGQSVGWNKLQRSGHMDGQGDESVSPAARGVPMRSEQQAVMPATREVAP